MAPGWLGLWLTMTGSREQNPQSVMDTRVEDSPLVHHVRETRSAVATNAMVSISNPPCSRAPISVADRG